MVDRIYDLIENPDLWREQSEKAYQKHIELSNRNLVEIEQALNDYKQFIL